MLSERPAPPLWPASSLVTPAPVVPHALVLSSLPAPPPLRHLTTPRRHVPTRADRAPSAGSEEVARREARRTRVDRAPRQRKADIPPCARTPCAPHRVPRVSRAESWCAHPHRPASERRSIARRARAGGQEEETTDAHQRPTSPCCSTAAVRTTRPLDPHAPAPAQRWCHPSRCALDEGSLRGATREEKTRHDEAADPRNTTRLFTTVKMYYLDDRPTSERQRADRTPRKRRAAPERAREHVFLPAAVRGRVARRKDDEGRSLHLPRDDSANECGGSGRRVSGRATSGRLDRSRTQNKHERTGSSGRSTSKSDSRRLGWKTFVWARRSDRVSWV